MHQKKLGILILLTLLTASLMVSCKPPELLYGSNPGEREVAESPRILFLNYQLKRDSAENSLNAHLLSMIIREGKYKASMDKTIQPERGDLEILVQDRNQTTLNSIYIPNPLDRSVEYVNDDGRLEYRMIQLDSVQFSVRLQIESRASSIVLNRITYDTEEGSLLLLTPIQ